MIFKYNMSKSWMILFFVIMSISHSIDGSYHYVGCYTQVFYESFFSSSFMEPTLCFRLCDTPIIYLQKTICRCSGGGLMHRNKQADKYCTIPCTKPADRQVKTANTCGGQLTYSAYVENDFYIQHGHLFNYQINFFACELWKTNDVYETIKVNLDSIVATSSLNKMERCAAACLDKNMTTKSIAFNDDNNQCLCIMPWKSNTAFQRTNYLTILSNTSCNRYCNNTPEDSNVDHKFQCGSLDDIRIWAIYDLNGTCPVDYVYVKEFQKCLYTYKNFWNTCTPPAKSYVYDGSNTWNDFLTMIKTLKLNQTLVTIDFDEDIVVNSSWKCPRTVTDASSSYYSYSSYYSWNSNTRYILDNGCLRESSYTSYTHRYSNRLCITNPLNKYSLSSDDETNTTYIPPASPQLKYCPTYWFDLNGRCYRMSDEPKTIRDARNSCITISETQLNNTAKSQLWSADDDYSEISIYDDEDDDDQLNDSPKGEIVQYTSEWQTRLGFFLLDTIPDTALPNSISSKSSHTPYYDDLISIESHPIYQASMNEFQMINPSENKNNSLNDDSCVISERSSVEVEERPIVKIISEKNCSTAKHVLCETNTLIVRDFQQGCFRKPSILDLPALISNRLTYELCLFVCKELQTILAILHMNKCYCLNWISSKAFNLTDNLGKYQKKDCGNVCSGNRHERCGDDDTIVVFHILDSRHATTDASTPIQPYPDFAYDSCVQISLNSSTTYQFNMNNIHPRHCLELCIKYQQKYALINGNKCFCTNIPVKNDRSTIILRNQECSLKCSANYFYTCGNKDNETIYSMYIMKPQCLHGFEVAENDQQCVYTHLSVKKNSFSIADTYCKSIGGEIARINDILEIQNILPESMLGTGFLKVYPFHYYIKSLHNTKYFWINRTVDTADDNNTMISGSLGKCSQVSETIDKNCLVIYNEPYGAFGRFNITVARLCIAESNQCSNVSAMPICVDQHIEPKPRLVSPITADISSNISIDYSCGDDREYHFVDDYCYKIKFHEISWNDAKSECEQENAMLFVPEKSITLHIIKSLFLHRTSYTSSGFAHVGVIYDYQNHTVIQYNTTDGTTQRTVPNSNVVYDLCEKTFLDRYTALVSTTGLSIQERNRLKRQQIGCGYIDLLSYTVPVIRCDEIPCNRTATVICQKLPILKTMFITAEREIIIPSMESPPINESSVASSQESTKSIGRDFAPIFFILATFFALILLAFISTLYNHRLYQKNNNISAIGRRNNNFIYSPLTSANEFDLN